MPAKPALDLPGLESMGDIRPLVEDRLADVLTRWDPLPFHRLKLHWLRPCTVRILFYADFQGAYAGSSFIGLTHVLATLSADPYAWVRFEVGRASRVADTSADPSLQSKTLDSIDLSKWDQIWFFGLGGLPGALSQAEVNAVSGWMDAGGGVLMTGDHADLGAGIGSQIPRAGKMRRWGQPSQAGPDRHSTLRSGADSNFDFDDQSDDVPQEIRPKMYPLWGWLPRSRPHPLLCGPSGTIRVLPDHMHEGEAIVPAALPAGEWPSGPGGQVVPEIVAWGRIIQPLLDKSGQEFGVIGAYDGHEAGVGRIVADSTWHHWFDINVTGLGTPGHIGFTTPGAAATMKAIEGYFLNTAIWLSPPARQSCMRTRAFLMALWSDRLVMLDRTLPIWQIGEAAIDALGRSAPRCTVYNWLRWPILQRVPKPWEPVEERLVPMIDEHVFGAIFKPLLEVSDGLVPPSGERALKAFEKRVNASLERAWSAGMEAAIEEALAGVRRTEQVLEGLREVESSR